MYEIPCSKSFYTLILFHSIVYYEKYLKDNISKLIYIYRFTDFSHFKMFSDFVCYYMFVFLAVHMQSPQAIDNICIIMDHSLKR